MRVLAIIGTVIVLGAIGLFIRARARRIPDRLEPVGPFEIVTHTTRYLYGWNEGKIREGTTEHYSVRYRGEPVRFTGKAGMFGDDSLAYERMNAIVTFPAREPVVLVNVGDPNNSSFFYLLREQNGGFEPEYVADSHGSISVDWLDPGPAGAGTVREISLHRARLEGGRYLLVGQYAVLDTETLTTHRFEYHKGASINQFKPALELSPDRTSFVRFGYAEDNSPILVVFDFVAPASYALPIDRRRMRFTLWEEMDLAWLHHHFEWRREPGAHDRLVERAFTPLPYRGYRRQDPYGDPYREYNLNGVSPEMRDTLIGFIVRAFDGERQPDSPGGSASVRIGGKLVHITAHDDELGVWMDRGQDATLVDQIADRFDAELATGKHDALFWNPPTP